MTAKQIEKELISIHTTLAGGDLMLPNRLDHFIKISIHTTLAGGDRKAL